MRKWVHALFLLFLLAFSCVVSCAYKLPKDTTLLEPQFRSEDYPESLYYIGVGIVVNNNLDRAREEAKLKAKEDLVTQLAHSTVTMSRTVQVKDDGREEQTLFEETISESFIQEIEGEIYKVEPYNSKKGVQITRAILSKMEWEVQKLTKIERERVQARAILSERYPEMPPTKEIVILNRVVTLLSEGIWGGLVEDRFDDTYGNILILSKARLNQLYPQVLQSSRVYSAHEGTSTYNYAHAKDFARRSFVSYLVNHLFSEFSPLQIRYSSYHSAAKLEEEISKYVNNLLIMNPSLVEYIPGPDSNQNFWQVYAVTPTALLSDALNRDIDKLQIQVSLAKSVLDEDETLSGKLEHLNKIRSLLRTSFMGLAVEDDLFPYGTQSLDAMEHSLIDSVKLILTVPKSIPKGLRDYIFIEVQSSIPFGSPIPVTLTIKGSSTLTKKIKMERNTSYYYLIDVPRKENAKNYTITIGWDGYPDKNVSETITISSVSIFRRLKNWLFPKEPELPFE